MLGPWWRQPFSADMDALHWALFIGLVIVAMLGWQIVLSHIVGGIES